jgi:histone arginine demethylase JMJD6
MSKKYLSLPHVERINNPSKEEFLEKYGIPGKPVLLLGLMENWKAKTRWTMDFFKSMYGNVRVKVKQVNAPHEKYTVILDTYIEYIKNCDVNNPYYLRDWQFHKNCPEILEDYDIPEYFNNWFQQLPPNSRPSLSWIFMRPKKTGTKMHQDVMMTSAWNAIISGKKCWLMYPPEQGKYLYFGEVDAFNPDIEKYPLFKEATPLVCFQNPGEIVFTPSGWWHQVINEEACISLTENFVNSSNYKLVREYLDAANSSTKTKQLLKEYIPQLYLDQGAILTE